MSIASDVVSGLGGGFLVILAENKFQISDAGFFLPFRVAHYQTRK
jgi:hypothetical protein